MPPLWFLRDLDDRKKRDNQARSISIPRPSSTPSNDQSSSTAPSTASSSVHTPVRHPSAATSTSKPNTQTSPKTSRHKKVDSTQSAGSSSAGHTQETDRDREFGGSAEREQMPREDRHAEDRSREKFRKMMSRIAGREAVEDARK